MICNRFRKRTLQTRCAREGRGHAQVPRLAVIGPQGPAWLSELGKAAPKRFPARDTRSPQNTQNSGSQPWLSWKPPRDLETIGMPDLSPRKADGIDLAGA